MVLVCKTIIINQNGMDPLWIKLDRCFSLSKLCNNFGIKNTTLKLSNTVDTCGSCNILHNRDINVALNLNTILYLNFNYNFHLKNNLNKFQITAW